MFTEPALGALTNGQIKPDLAENNHLSSSDSEVQMSNESVSFSVKEEADFLKCREVNQDSFESESVSDNGCDQSCNIGAVNLTIDTNNGSLNQETSKPSGLQLNSNVNNNDILNDLNLTNSNKFKPKSPCSKLGIDLLTAIEEQAVRKSEVNCSPRTARTRSVETAILPKRSAKKRALSADADHRGVKWRRLDFGKAKTITTPKNEHKEDRSKSRRHESTKKHDKRRSSSSRKKSVGTQTRSHRDLSNEPRLMTNGNYSYLPSDVSFIDLNHKRIEKIDASHWKRKLLRKELFS